jgi:hypothetical protein
VLEPVKGPWGVSRDAQSQLTLFFRFLAPRPVSCAIFRTLHSANISSKPRWAETAPRPQHDTGGSDCQVRLPAWQHLCGPSRCRGIGTRDCDHSLHDAQWQHRSRARESNTRLTKSLSDIAVQVSKSSMRIVHIDAYSRSGKFIDPSVH